MSKYRITIDLEINPPDNNMIALTQDTADAILKEALTSHLRWVMEWLTSDMKDRNPAAAEQAIAYHRTWADILDRADFKMEKI
jgi:hypothetical protein